MKTLPLFYYPSTWVWVDDDKTLLGAMARIFNKINPVLPFQSASECLGYLKNYQSPLIRHGFLKNNPEDENYGILQSAPLNFNIQTIVNLLLDPRRHDEITAMVIDYNMPGINGFELAELTQQLLIPKILLTGAVHQDGMVSPVFNNHLIDRFVQKSEPEMINKLMMYLQKLSYEYFRTITLPMLSYLEAKEKLPLSDPTFIDFFEMHCQAHSVREYYLIDKQGSFLCVDSQGRQFYLVIHTQRSINDWLSIYGNENSFNSTELKAVKEYKKIPFFGIHSGGASQIDPQQWSAHFYEPQRLVGRQTYFWTITKIS